MSEYTVEMFTEALRRAVGPFDYEYVPERKDWWYRICDSRDDAVGAARTAADAEEMVKRLSRWTTNDTPLRSALLATLVGLQDAIPPSDGSGAQTSYKNLRWMVTTCIEDIEIMPVDKISRWVGFVQGVLATKGCLSVTDERNRTRPFFHKAYAEMGITASNSRNMDD